MRSLGKILTDQRSPPSRALLARMMINALCDEKADVQRKASMSSATDQNFAWQVLVLGACISWPLSDNSGTSALVDVEQEWDILSLCKNIRRFFSDALNASVTTASAPSFLISSRLSNESLQRLLPKYRSTKLLLAFLILSNHTCCFRNLAILPFRTQQDRGQWLASLHRPSQITLRLQKAFSRARDSL